MSDTWGALDLHSEIKSLYGGHYAQNTDCSKSLCKVTAHFKLIVQSCLRSDVAAM